MTILILDGNNIAHRVRHVFSLSRPDGLDCSVTYGFLHNLRSLMLRFAPDAIIVAWDGGIPRFRRELVPSYKINRTHKDDDTYPDFVRQLKELNNEVLPLTGVLQVRRSSMEADDIMYHAAFMALGRYDEIIIVSNDDDMLQATVMRNVFVYKAGKDVLAGENYVEEQYGVTARSMVHWRAIQGDSSDNIKGVPGIGPKKATKLFKEYNNSLSAIVNAAYGNNPNGSIGGKMGENIREFGLESISKNVKAMVLTFDRTGARLAINDEMEYYKKADIPWFKNYLQRNAFISLMEPDVYSGFRKLSLPDLNTNIRMPVVCDHRFPME